VCVCGFSEEGGAWQEVLRPGSKHQTDSPRWFWTRLMSYHGRKRSPGGSVGNMTQVGFKPGWRIDR
jgi:hypothetical protein